MKLVVLESPFSGDIEKNREYACKCVLDSLSRGEAPVASHLLLTQVLNDSDPNERMRGMEAGVAWTRVAHASVVYTDFGISRGMEYGIEAATKAGIPVEYRKLWQR